MLCLTAFEHDTYSSMGVAQTSVCGFEGVVHRLKPVPLFTLFECGTPFIMVQDERDDAYWMRQAIAAARDAQQRGEIPVGTCIVSGDTVLANAGNRTRTDLDPTAHAEIVALRKAAQSLGNYRLTGAVVYSTIEPCAMCAGALIQARVKRLVYGAPDERAGAVKSRFGICDTEFLNHRIEVTTGVLEDECRELMQDFFKLRRESQRVKDEG